MRTRDKTRALFANPHTLCYTTPMKTAYEKIYAAARRIPAGRVSTYGQLARLAGNPRWARVAGYAMSACRGGDVPCHRVVNRLGGLCDAFEPLGRETQRMLLEAEGVGFLPDGRVDMARFLWDGAEYLLPEERP